MVALLLSFVSCWFIVLVYRHMGGTLTQPKPKTSSVTVHDYSRHLDQFRQDIETAIANGTLFTNTATNYEGPASARAVEPFQLAA